MIFTDTRWKYFSNTLLERIEQVRWGRYCIDNVASCGQKAQKPRLAVVVVMVWYRMFISDPIVTSTRKTNRNILDFKYFFLPCHVPCFPCVRYQRSGLSKIRANIGRHTTALNIDI